jgi:hypothetical protein
MQLGVRIGSGEHHRHQTAHSGDEGIVAATLQNRPGRMQSSSETLPDRKSTKRRKMRTHRHLAEVHEASMLPSGCSKEAVADIQRPAQNSIRSFATSTGPEKYFCTSSAQDV